MKRAQCPLIQNNQMKKLSPFIVWQSHGITRSQVDPIINEKLQIGLITELQCMPADM